MSALPIDRVPAVAVSLALGLGLAVASAAEEIAPDRALFEFEGRAYTAADIGPKLGKMLHELRVRQHEEQAALIDEMLFEAYLDAEAMRTGETRREVAGRLLSAAEPTDEEIERFYADNRLRIDEPLDALRPRIARLLRRERLVEDKTALLDRIKREGAFKAALEPVRDPPFAFDLFGMPVRGEPDAPITVVEFGDYQCPGCGRAAAIMTRVLERFAGDVRLVYLDFPVNRSGISRRVAEGAVCAHEQGAFWAYHDLAFARQEALRASSPGELARALDLDAAAFARCLESDAPRARIRRAERQARALGVGGTPAVYVNGRPLATHDLEGDLVARIEALKGR